jgi:hypothetical protein
MFFRFASLTFLLVGSNATTSAETVSFPVALDRWMYPFAFSGGTRDIAPTFGAVGNEGFDGRDGQFILGFDTSPNIAVGQGADRYQINSLTIKAMVGSPSGFIYDPTYDAFRTYLDPSNPQFESDADLGRPIELHGIGFRNGYTALSFEPTDTQPPEFEESAPFGPADAGTRNVFPLGFLTAVAGSDISNNVDLEFESHPWAIGTTALAEGDAVPNNTTLSFAVDVANADVRNYVQRGLDSGVLGFAVTSLHEAAQTGGPPIPQFITKENARAGSVPAVLEIDYQLIPPLSPASTWNLDGGGDWSSAANWTGAIPNAIGATAVFGNKITAPSTVTVDMPMTVGQVDFNSPSAYTIAGTNALTLAATTGDAQINVTTGSHAISAPVTLAGNATFTVTSAASNLSIAGTLSAAGQSLTKAGAGALTVSNVRAQALAINGGTVATAPHGGAAGTSVLSGLTIAGGDNAWTAKLDLADNDAVIQSTATNKAADFARLVNQVKQGFNDGTWSGLGITSATAAANANADTGLSVADNALLGYSEFSGQAVTADSILLKYTYYGDIDANGAVDADDLTVFAYNFGRTSGTMQIDGDIDFNGAVNADDLTVLANNFSRGVGNPLGSGAVQAIREPASLVLAGLAAAVAFLVIGIRRRRT